MKIGRNNEDWYFKKNGFRANKSRMSLSRSLNSLIELAKLWVQVVFLYQIKYILGWGGSYIWLKPNFWEKNLKGETLLCELTKVYIKNCFQMTSFILKMLWSAAEFICFLFQSQPLQVQLITRCPKRIWSRIHVTPTDSAPNLPSPTPSTIRLKVRGQWLSLTHTHTIHKVLLNSVLMYAPLHNMKVLSNGLFQIYELMNLIDLTYSKLQFKGDQMRRLQIPRHIESCPNKFKLLQYKMLHVL